MKIHFVNLFALTLIALSACSSSENGDKLQDALDSEKSELTQELQDSLSYMGNEERLAYDVYNTLYEKHGTKQFTNIATKSEYRHIQAVLDLVNKYKLNDTKSFSNIDSEPLGNHDKTIEEMPAGVYDIVKIQTLHDDLVEMGSKSEIDGLKVGCIIEVIDVNDLNEYIHLAAESDAPDIERVFTFLRDGSYNHYWAFDNGLKNAA